MNVKIITIGIIISMMLVIFSMFSLIADHSIVIVSCGIIMILFILIYPNSLSNVCVGEKEIVLEKPFNKIVIPYIDFIRIERIENSNLSMTYGSQGIFGYIGSTMDNNISFVKDRNIMIRIITTDKKYILSCETPDDLIRHLTIKQKISK